MQETVFYPSKILLFGEYTVINGGKALAMPFHKYAGSWAMNGSLQQQMNLKEWANYLKQHFKAFRYHEMESELRKGLYFDSNIPTGYGLGSSGALCAATYSRFFDKKEELSPRRLKVLFAKMESFFHGKSSGLDPLVCYLQESILIDKDEIKNLGLPLFSEKRTALFLLDTGMSRHTEPLVTHYIGCMKEAAFAEKIRKLLLPANDAIITAYINGDWEMLKKQFKLISSIQLELFDKMIPTPFREIWSKGLLTDEYYLKLCGAGGGGFFIGFSEKKSSLEKIFSPYQILNI